MNKEMIVSSNAHETVIHCFSNWIGKMSVMKNRAAPPCQASRASPVAALALRF